MDLVNEAFIFAVKAHAGMKRKKSQVPYILHPLEAAVIVSTITDDPNVIAAAALHDVVEDTDITIEEIEEKFGSRIKELVSSETENKRDDLPASDTWRIRKEETLAILEKTDDLDILILWIGDKLANMRSIYREWKREGDAVWQNFNQKNVDEQAWYYKTIVKLTERLNTTSAWLEYKTLTEIVFNKGEKENGN